MPLHQLRQQNRLKSTSRPEDESPPLTLPPKHRPSMLEKDLPRLSTAAPDKNIVDLSFASTSSANHSTASSRGRSATRGGSSLSGRHVFDDSMRKRKKRTNLYDNASDPKSNQKLFTNARLQRRTELMGRNVADRAPDIEALGGLFDPSKPPTKQARLQKKHSLSEVDRQLSKASPPTIDAQPPSRTVSLPIQTDTVAAYAPRWHSEQERPKESTPPYQPPYGNRAFICYWWATKGKCNKENSCPYVHEAVNLPVAPMPDNVRNSKNQPCVYYFERGGYIYTEEQCQYSHGGANIDPPQTSANIGSRTSTKDFPLWDDHDTETSPQDALPALPAMQLTTETSIERKKSKTSDPPFRTQYRARDGTYRSKIPTTCWYWKEDNCRQIDATCRYFHRYPPFEPPAPQARQSSGSSELPAKPAIKGILKPSAEQPLASDDRRNTSDSNASTTKSSVNQRDTISEQSLFIPETDQALPNEDVNMEVLQEPVVETPLKIAASTKPSNITPEEYQRKKIIKTLGPKAKQVVFGPNDGRLVILDFGDVDTSEPWSQKFSSLDVINFERICAAQDFHVQYSGLISHIYKHGHVSIAHLGSSDQKHAERLYDSLRLGDAGLFFSKADLSILLYPAKTPKWSFLEDLDSSPSPVARLRFLIFRSDIDLSQCQVSSQHGITEKSSTYWGLLANKIRWTSLKPMCKSGDKLPRHFYLMFPSSADLTASFVKTFIEAHASGSKIYHAAREGSWDAFVQADIRTRVLVIHESVVSCIADLPGLLEVHRKGDLHVWCIGGDSDSLYDLYPSTLLGPSPQTPQLTCTSLFPHGGAIFLTPSLLIAEPRFAYDALKWFISKQRGSTPGTWKLVCGFNLKDYLLDLAIEKSLERDDFYTKHADKPSKDADAAALNMSYEDCNTRFKLQSKFNDLLQNQELVGYPFDYDLDYPDEAMSPIVYAPSSIDPDDEQGLVEWFAGWAIIKAELYRKFVVVGTGQDGLRAVRPKVVKKPKVKATQILPKQRSPVGFSLQHSGANLPKKPSHRVSDAGKRSSSPLAYDRISDRSKLGSHTVRTSSSRFSLDGSEDHEPSRIPNLRQPAINPDNPMTMVATRHLKATASQLGTQPGDHIILSKFISGDLYYARNLRTQEKGQVSLNNVRSIGTLDMPYDESNAENATEDSDLMNVDTPEDSIQASLLAQYDGPLDPPSRPQSRSGIIINENGKRVIPASRRPSGTERPERRIKTGFIPEEDREKYRHPNSRRGSMSGSGDASSPAGGEDSMVIDEAREVKSNMRK